MYQVDNKILIRNIFQCKLCGDIIESKRHYHNVKCSCGFLSIDGGLEYIRVTGNKEDIIDLTKWLEVSSETSQKALKK